MIEFEGQKTEPRYLYAFSQACTANRRFTITIKPGKGQNALVTMEAATREDNRKLLGEKIYDEICCVLDVEHAAHEAKLSEALALAKQHQIEVYLSNPSFEVWMLAHFERATRSFENSSAAEHRLEEAYWKKHFGCNYDKRDPRLYERLGPFRDTAVDNSQWLLETFHENNPCRDCNSSTEVYKLVRRLLPPE